MARNYERGPAGEDYKKVNPCGKVPAINDPNTDVTIWESGAIVLYLIDQFNLFQHPKVPAAIERYNAQVARILGVLNTVLENKEWLVGDKCTYADLSFFMWNNTLPYTIQAPEGTDAWQPYPHVKAWPDCMAAREAVKKTLELQTEMGNKEDEATKAAQGE